MNDTLSIVDFTRAMLLNRCLREGNFSGPRRAGVDTSLWASLKLLTPEQTPDGGWRGDALYFFSTPVHEPLMLLQNTLRNVCREYGIVPNPGEHFTQEFIPRLVTAIAEKKKTTMGDTVEMDAVHRAMITPLDAMGLRAMMLSVFDLNDEPVEHQDEVLTHTGQMVFEKFISDAYDMLSSEDQDKIELLIEKSEDPNEVMEFLEHRLADFDTLLAGQVLAARQQYDEVNKKVSETPIQRGE